MISAAHIRQLVEEKLEGTDMFIIELSVSPSNRITVELDGMQGVSINDCVQVSRQIESNLDRESEDFELHVSSAGIDKPLRDKRQYLKNIGREVKLRLQNGEEYKGELVAAGESVQLSLPPVKKKKLPARTENFPWESIQETKIVISFK